MPATGWVLDEPQDLPTPARLVQYEIFYRVLTGPLGPCLRTIAKTDSKTHRIARAIEWLHQRYDQPLRVNELAAVARMSKGDE